MSRAAVAAVLALEDLSGGERLVAIALASYADRDNRAWPGAPAAAARAGLGRSRYQEAREKLIRRGLLDVDERATGRGRASTVSLAFADTGPWWDGDVNVELLEAVLSYSRASGPARMLLAAMAALADDDGTVRELSSEQLCAAAGVTDRTYRRARRALLASGELVLMSGTGGRGNTNVWAVADPRHVNGTEPVRAKRRVPPPAGARPLVASTRAVAAETSTSSAAVKGGQDRTLFELPPPETPAQTPAETPAPNARAGREPQNPRTRKDPPSPPEGGSLPDSVTVEQSYVTERGRRRGRLVRIDLDEVRRGLGIPTTADCNDWQRIRELLEERVGESTFAIWLVPVELIAVDSECRLVLAVPSATAAWTTKRFGRLLANCSARIGRELRLADESERIALGCGDGRPALAARGVHINQQEVS